SYPPESVPGGFLRGEPEAIGTVSRWIAIVLTDTRYFGLFGEWSDLHQEAMTGVLSSLRRGRFDERRDFRSYVMAVARFTMRNAARQRRRRHQVDHPVALKLADSSTPSPEAILLRELAVRRVLARLSQSCQDLIAAYFFEQRDAEEIAEAQGIPVGTV